MAQPQSNGGNFSYNDGTTQWHFSSQQFTLTGFSQGDSAQAPLPAQGVHPSAFPDHNQLLQGHMALHAAAMQSRHQMHQNLLQGSFPYVMPQVQPQYPALAQPSQQPQIGYHQQAPQAQLAPPPQQLQIAAGDQQHRAAVPYNRVDELTRILNREKERADDRFSRLEQVQTSNRQQQDREIAAGRAREEQLRQQMLEMEERHRREREEAAAATAPQTQPVSPPFDMSTMQRVIDEVRRDQISRGDIKQLIEETLQGQLVGVARTKDIESAASRMEKGLNQVPTGASVGQIQQAMQQELDKAVRKASKHAVHHSIEGTSSQPGAIHAQHIPQARAEWTVEEIPREEDGQRGSGRSTSQSFKTLPAHAPSVASAASSTNMQKQRVLVASPTPYQVAPQLTASPLQVSKEVVHQQVAPRQTIAQPLPPVIITNPSEPQRNRLQLLPASAPTAEQQLGSHLTAAALAQLPSGDTTSKSRDHKSRASVQPGKRNALTRIKNLEHKSSRSSKKSTASVQPSGQNAMVPFRSLPQQFQSSAGAMVAAQAQGGRLEGAGHLAYKGIPDDPSDPFPDNTSQVSSWQRRQESWAPVRNNDTVAVARLRNDRRVRTAPPSALGQIEAVPEEDANGQQLVLQSRDLSQRRNR